VKTNVHLYHIALISLRMRFFQAKDVKKSKHTLYSGTYLFWKSCRLWDNIEKYINAAEVTDNSMMREHSMLDT